MSWHRSTFHISGPLQGDSTEFSKAPVVRIWGVSTLTGTTGEKGQLLVICDTTKASTTYRNVFEYDW